MKIKFPIILLLPLVFFSCIDRNQRSLRHLKLAKDIPIKKEGIYISKERNLVLNIQERNMLVEYSLSDTTGRILYKPQKPDVSDVQRWSFIMDSTGNVWLNSSDIGLYLLKRESDTSFSISGFDEKMTKRIPESVYKDLSGSTKKHVNREGYHI